MVFSLLGGMMRRILITSITVLLLSAFVLSGCIPETKYVNQTILATQTVVSEHTVTQTITVTKESNQTNTSSNSTTDTTGSIITVSINDISNLYENNEIAADATYLNKTLVVTGVIESIAVSIFDEPYIKLKSTGYARYTLWCYFKEKNDLVELREGQTVSIQGICTGKVTFFYYIDFKNCILIR